MNTALSPNDDRLAEAIAGCAAEPIHHIGHIQPHGVLLVLGPSPARAILQASDNIQHFFGRPVDDLLGEPLATLIGEEQAEELEGRLAETAEGALASAMIYSVVGEDILELHTGIRAQGRGAVLEMEPIRHAYQLADVSALFEEVRFATLQLEQVEDLSTYCQRLAELIWQSTGFARVMVYRFDTNWDGEVIAESRREDADSYLGNRFPASDIPPQARDLYSRNLLRFVEDADTPTVPIVPATHPATGAPLDLSDCVLRAFSPVHMTYLKNMGVRASLSLSLILNGRLWGLVACHHPTPMHVGQPVRDMLRFLGKIVSMRLSVMDSQARLVEAGQLNRTLVAVLRDMHTQADPRLSLARHAEALLGAVQAGGAVFVVGHERLVIGEVPDAAALDVLLDWLPCQDSPAAYVTSQLSAVCPAARADIRVAAGLLAVPLAVDFQRAVLWFRPEKLRTVRWAGKPEKAVSEDASGRLHLSPRSSFAEWHEIWRERSEAWQPAEIEAGTVVAETLVDILTARLR